MQKTGNPALQPPRGGNGLQVRNNFLLTFGVPAAPNNKVPGTNPAPPKLAEGEPDHDVPREASHYRRQDAGCWSPPGQIPPDILKFFFY